MDDEKFIRDLAVQMLTKIGYEVSVAADGDQAIEMYRQAQETAKPFDIVIMDLTVPGGVGGRAQRSDRGRQQRGLALHRELVVAGGRGRVREIADGHDE